MLDLEFLRGVWREAISPGLPEAATAAATPEAFDRGVLTVRAADREAATVLHRRRREIRDRILAAAGLPGVRLRVRVVGRGETA